MRDSPEYPEPRHRCIGRTYTWRASKFTGSKPGRMKRNRRHKHAPHSGETRRREDEDATAEAANVTATTLHLVRTARPPSQVHASCFSCCHPQFAYTGSTALLPLHIRYLRAQERVTQRLRRCHALRRVVP